MEKVNLHHYRNGGIKLKDIKVGDKIEVEITKITIGRDRKVYVTIKNEWFQNNPTLVTEQDMFVWESSTTGRVTLK